MKKVNENAFHVNNTTSQLSLVIIFTGKTMKLQGNLTGNLAFQVHAG